jgi:hypothetical protein
MATRLRRSELQALPPTESEDIMQTDPELNFQAEDGGGCPWWLLALAWLGFFLFAALVWTITLPLRIKRAFSRSGKRGRFFGQPTRPTSLADARLHRSVEFSNHQPKNTR